jgi:hypothetical protein
MPRLFQREFSGFIAKDGNDREAVRLQQRSSRGDQLLLVCNLKDHRIGYAFTGRRPHD